MRCIERHQDHLQSNQLLGLFFWSLTLCLSFVMRSTRPRVIGETRDLNEVYIANGCASLLVYKCQKALSYRCMFLPSIGIPPFSELTLNSMSYIDYDETRACRVPRLTGQQRLATSQYLLNRISVRWVSQLLVDTLVNLLRRLGRIVSKVLMFFCFPIKEETAVGSPIHICFRIYANSA